jgi:predicted nucleic acid-binding Zn ribbon protein
MRKSNTQPLGDVLRDYLRAMGMDKKLLEIRLIDGWPHVVGMAIAKKTTNLYINKRVLFVYLNSSVAKHQLTMIRDGLVKALNDRVGENLIDEIVFKAN